MRTTTIENIQVEQAKRLLELEAKMAMAQSNHNNLALAVERLPTRDEMISAMRDLRTDLRDDIRELNRA